MIPANATEAARYLLADILPSAACAVDATAGNGHDTLYMCKNTPANCQIWSFDIRQAALDACAGLLARQGYGNKARLILADHATLNDYVGMPVDAAMFNLGYLPGHERTPTTRPQSLKPALDSLLELLSPGGLITIVAYPGHAPGQEEIDFLDSYLGLLPQKFLTAAKFCYLNQKNFPAILYSIGKARRRKRNRGKSGNPNPG